MKLQEAFAAENNAVGTWAAIGYKGPGSQNADGSGSVTSTFTYSDNSTDEAGVWLATAKVALNECGANGTMGTWTVSTAYASGDVNTTAASNNEGACVTPLVPNFCKIATSGACTTASNGGGNG